MKNGHFCFLSTKWSSVSVRDASHSPMIFLCLLELGDAESSNNIGSVDTSVFVYVWEICLFQEMSNVT